MTAPTTETRPTEGQPVPGGQQAWSLADLDAEPETGSDDGEGGGDDPGDPGDPGDGRRARRRRRRRRTLLAAVVVLLLLAGVPLGVGWYLQHRLTSQIGRIDGVFQGLPASQRPDKPAAGTPGANAVNILLMGTDRVSDVATTGTDAKASDWVQGAQRSDTLMVLHIDSSRQVAAVVSIPRDSWVQIPGHGYGKINWAYSFGGPSLTVATVEKLTGLRIDHLAVVDWEGFKELTDHVGGVDIDVPETVVDPHNHVTWTAGRHHLDGEQALLYVRQRYGLPGGDFDRVKRQQAFLKSVLDANLHTAMRKDPTMLYGFLETLARNISVDSGWSTADMAKLAFSLRDFRSANLRFMTVPVLGTGRVGSQSVVRLDVPAGQELWQDLRSDRIDQWSAVHWEELTSDVVR